LGPTPTTGVHPNVPFPPSSQGRSQAWALWGLSHPKQKYSPPNEIKPIGPFGLRFFAKYVSTFLAAGAIFVFR